MHYFLALLSYVKDRKIIRIRKKINLALRTTAISTLQLFIRYLSSYGSNFPIKSVIEIGALGWY